MIVRYEDGKWINNIGVYFAILRDINESLLELINFDPNFSEEIEVLFFNIAVNLNRIVPMQHRELSYKDGILKLKNYFSFLKEDYKRIYKMYKEDLVIINDVRNKFEHVPHVIKWREYMGNDKEKQMWFINNEYNTDIIEGNEEEISKKEEKGEKLEWKIDTNVFIKIIIEVDNVFLKIQTQLKEYFKNDKDALEHPYIKNIIQINIVDYIDKLKEYIT